MCCCCCCKQIQRSSVLIVRTSITSWCARQIKSRSCLWRNLATTSAPNVNDTPRSFSPQPIVSLSGSDHSKSHSRPWSGTSVGRMIRRICSMDCRSGLKPTIINTSMLHYSITLSSSSSSTSAALCGLRRFLAGCRIRRLNQALSVLSLSLDCFECVRFLECVLLWFGSRYWRFINWF